jgi:hypothetical protein
VIAGEFIRASQEVTGAGLDATRRLLAKALGDPSLELVYWLPGFEC